MKKIIVLLLVLLLSIINVNAEEIEKITIENVALPIIGEKYSDYLIRAKKDNWSYGDNFTIADYRLSLSETDPTRGIIACTYMSDATVQYIRGPKGQGYSNTALTDNDTFEEGNDYSCAIEIAPKEGYTISESLVGNNDTNDLLTNISSNVLINKIQSKLHKYTLISSTYNITFNFKPGYKISFVTNTDNNLYDVYALPNEKIDEPTNIVKNNYELLGWYTSDSYETKWNFTSDKVTTNMTLYAKWLKVEANPKTGDNIILSIILGSISLISLIVLTLYYKKHNNKNLIH